MGHAAFAGWCKGDLHPKRVPAAVRPTEEEVPRCIACIPNLKPKAIRLAAARCLCAASEQCCLFIDRTKGPCLTVYPYYKDSFEDEY